jgi:hypothetical protein
MFGGGGGLLVPFDAVFCKLRRVALQSIFCNGDDITKADLAMNKTMRQTDEHKT